MKYGVVIVGAGSAGGVLAARLSEDPDRSVLLIEAGADYPDLESVPPSIKYGYNQFAAATPPHIWVYLTNPSPQAIEPLPTVSGRVMGGSSSLNGQTFLRGMPEDYDVWASHGNDEWSFVKCLPYFRKLETDFDFSGDFHGSDGPIPVRRHSKETWFPMQAALYEAGRNAGFADNPDLNHPEATGPGPLPTNNVNGVRMSTAITYVNPVRHRSNLTIMAETLARRILLDGRRAVGVELEKDGERSVVHGDEIIVSAGAINSPQLLMLSGIGPPDHLRGHGISLLHESPGIGQNLMDHPLLPVKVRVSQGFPLDTDQPWVQTGMPYTASGSKDRNDMFMGGKSYDDPPEDDPRWGPEDWFAGMFVCLNYPIARGELTLISTDPDMQPRLEYRYLSDPWDLQRTREGVQLIAELLKDSAFKSLVIEQLSPTPQDLASDKTLDDWLFQHLNTSFHNSGTCKMGPACDPLAVVDQYCRVHGLENLRVVDASVMPDLIRANANCTVIMIAERVADWIKGVQPQERG